MTTDLFGVVDTPKSNDASVTNTEACGGINKTTAMALRHPSPNRLPFELLAIIFLEYAQLFPLWTTRVPLWVAVSYVPQHWHNAALGCTSLWARLFFVSPEWMDELLVRSKAVPLFIYVNFCHVRESDSGPIRSLG